MAINNQRLFLTFRQRWEMIFLVLILGVSIPVIIWLPERMVQQAYHGDHEKSITSANNYAKLVDDYRKTVVQIIGGAFLLYTLYLTQRRTKAAEETLRISQKTLEVTRETQITDRFTKAVAQLGATDSQGKKQLEIRFGGIYALERIAKDSPNDHWPIVEILTAYVRENAPWREPETTEAGNIINSVSHPDKDIQAIMTVIGRRNKEHDKGNLDFSKVNLQSIDLCGAHLERADLAEAHLEKAKLDDVHLEDSDLFNAHLEGVSLHRAHLKEARMIGVHLDRASLVGAHLEGVDLAAASLQRAILAEAHLEKATLLDVNLERAILSDAHLEGAVLNRGVYLKSAYLERAYLEGAKLSEVVGLTQKQIDAAFGDYETKLPPGLKYPDHWPKAPNEQDSNQQG